MVDVARARKLAERIKVLVAESLEKTVKDPDLGFVTLTEVKVTPDLQHAQIFYTVYGSDEDRARSNEIIKRNTGRIRGDVGHNLSIRLTPTLEFIADELPENAAHLRLQRQLTMRGSSTLTRNQRPKKIRTNLGHPRFGFD
jgi:ribosome-binding factor A